MKIGLPRGWFARILLGGWALLIAAMLGTLLLAVLAPVSWDGDLLKPLLALNVVVMLGTLAYAAVLAVRRLRYYLGARLRNGSLTSTMRPIERILLAGWLLWVVLAFGALLFSRQKWILTFGPEVLFGLLLVVLLSSSAYGSYLLLHQLMKHLRRD